MRKAVQSRGRRSSPLDALVKMHDKREAVLQLQKEATEADAEADAEAGTKDGTEEWHDEWNDEWHDEWQPGDVGYYYDYDDNGAETIDFETEAKHKGSEESEAKKRNAAEKAQRGRNLRKKKGGVLAPPFF